MDLSHYIAVTSSVTYTVRDRMSISDVFEPADGDEKYFKSETL